MYKSSIYASDAGKERSAASFWASAFISAAAAFLLAFPSTASAKDVPEFKSGHGIKVLGAHWLHGSRRLQTRGCT